MTSLLIYIILLFILPGILMLYSIKANNRIQSFIENHYITIIILSSLSLLYKLPYDFSFFQGLEYEDSYLANSISRYFMYNRETADISFLANTCGVGSLRDCQASFSHSGNLIGLPTIVWCINEIFGYNIHNIALINLTFSIVSSIAIYIVCYKITKERIYGLISSAIYITTPILNSFHTSSLFETSASCLTLVSLLIFIVYFDNYRKWKSKNRVVLFIILILINLFSIHFKRENIIILSFPFILTLVELLKSTDSFLYNIKKLLPYSFFLLLLTFYYVYFLNIQSSLDAETEYALGNPFQLKFFMPLFTMFIKGFSTLKWFYLFGVFIVIGTIFILIDIKKIPKLLYPISIFIMFIIVNSIHHRSYYFVRSGNVSAFDSLRHINMLSPYFAMVSGYGIYRIVMLSRNLNIFAKRTWLLNTIILVVFVHLLYLTYTTRYDLIEIENHDRIEPISALLKIIDNKDIIITDQSILAHNYCHPDLKIIEFTTLGNFVSEDQIVKLLETSNIFFLRKDFFEEEVFRNRYKDSFRVIEKFTQEKIQVGDRYAIFKLKSKK